MHRLEQLFQQFLRERTYINNVTSSTREWYESAWKAFKAAQAHAGTAHVIAPDHQS